MNTFPLTYWENQVKQLTLAGCIENRDQSSCPQKTDKLQMTPNIKMKGLATTIVEDVDMKD